MQRGGPTDRWLARAGRSVYESAQFIAGPPDRYLVNGSPWMVDIERAGGGCMVNLAPHFVDLFLRSAGAEEVAVTAALSSTLHGGSVEDYASMTMTTADGRIATIEVGYAFPGSPLKRHCSFTRIGAAGIATIWSDGNASFTSVDGVTRDRTSSSWTATRCTEHSSTRWPSSWDAVSRISRGSATSRPRWPPSGMRTPSAGGGEPFTPNSNEAAAAAGAYDRAAEFRYQPAASGPGSVQPRKQ